MPILPFTPKKPKGSDEPKPDHSDVARSMLLGKDIVYSEGYFWEYIFDKGIWELIPDVLIPKLVSQACLALDVRATGSVISGAQKFAASFAYKKVPWDHTNPRDIALQNGVLHHENDQWLLKPYQKDDYRRICLPISYDQNAKCPRFTRFVQEIFQGTDDAKERVRALVEMLGLSLMSTTEFEKGLILVGNGSNGKSVIMKLLSAMLGSHAAAVNPEALNNDFMRARLHGKLANIVTELKEGVVLPDDVIKTLITGSEPITVQYKHKDPFEMFSTCKFWIGTNHMPSTRDFSDALFRRFTILEFPMKFVDRVEDVGPGKILKDTKLAGKLIEEIPGILNAILVVLNSTLQRGQLTIPPSSVEAIESWRRDTDQVLAFLEDQIIREPGSKIESGEIFKIYRQWANDNGIIRVVAKNTLTRRITALGWGELGRDKRSRYIFGLRKRTMSDL